MKVSEVSVLVVDDDACDCESIRRHLDGSIPQVAIATVRCIEDAIAWTKDHTANVVMLDMNLPDSHGLETIETIRGLNMDWVIIACSGDDNPNLYVDALAAGADDFICKANLSSVMWHRCLMQNLERFKHAKKIKKLVDEGRQQSLAIRKQSIELQTKNRELQHLYESAKRFVNNVSHEFRTPLCVIRQYASLLADGMVGEVAGEQVRLLRTIEGRVDGLNNMVDDMLDISRHENGLLSANRNRCQIEGIVEKVAAGLASRADLRSVELVTQCEPDLPVTFCDPEKVERTFVNFVTNAIKFTDGDKVHLRARRGGSGDEVLLEVEDHGPGIEPDQLEALFGRFAQGRNRLECDTKGFGLGLNIARELIDLNLGQISIDSVFGVGSTFGFTVPVDRPRSIVDRYLKRIEKLAATKSQPAFEVSSDIETDPCMRIDGGQTPVSAENATESVAGFIASVETNEKQEIDSFLNYLLRCDDLVYPTSAREFIVLLRTDEAGMTAFLSRAEKEWVAINRNRPRGALPTIAWKNVGCYRVPSQRSELMNRLGLRNQVPQPPKMHFDASAAPVAVQVMS